MIIVYTTGVYDMFHIGHYNFLKSASKYGKLIVGVTSDNLVKKEKNKIPVVNEKDRMIVIKNLSFVNDVILHENSDKVEMHKKLNFTHCIIGSDWKGHYTYNEFEKNLPEVKFIYLSYTNGISTTYINELLSKPDKYHIKEINLTENEKNNYFCLDNINNYPDKLPRNCNFQHPNYYKNGYKEYKGRNSWMELECMKLSQNTKYSVKFICWYINANNLYIITERFGIPLSQMKKYSITNNIATKILLGINELHKLGIHHNDITIDNILVDNEEIKICDYGWSNCLGKMNFSSDYYYSNIMLYELGYRSKYIGDLVKFDYKSNLNNLDMLKRSVIKDNTISDKEIECICNNIIELDSTMELILKISCQAFEKHGIRPYLAGGFLIGYLRNGDRIPWDHDFDFHMTMEEFKIVNSLEFKNTVSNIGKTHNVYATTIIYSCKIVKIIVQKNFIKKIENTNIFADLIVDKNFTQNNIDYINGNVNKIKATNEINKKIDIYPLKEIKKTDYSIFIPNSPNIIVEKQYGLNCLDQIPHKGDDYNDIKLKYIIYMLNRK
jgi:glycerol-3-phosphate cytidylyltransferase